MKMFTKNESSSCFLNIKYLGFPFEQIHLKLQRTFEFRQDRVMEIFSFNILLTLELDGNSLLGLARLEVEKHFFNRKK